MTESYSQMDNRGYFITGTDTAIGKTYSSVCLIEHLCAAGFSVVGLKPVASGCEQTGDGLRNSDALKLAEASNVKLEYRQINRYAFEPAIAPHLAAASRGVSIDIDNIRADLLYAKSKADRVVVEAAGGWLVPLNSRNSVADMALALELPVIIVVGIKLGCINHALLTLDQIERSGIKIAGWVANRIDRKTACAHEQIESIKSRTSIPCIAEIPNKKISHSTIQWRLEG